MTLSFSTTKQQGLANDDAKLRKYIAKAKLTCSDIDVNSTLNALQAADCLADVPKVPYHPHPLSGSLKGSFAVWINSSERIVFYPDNLEDEGFRIDDFRTIKKIVITDVCIDYHKR